MIRVKKIKDRKSKLKIILSFSFLIILFFSLFVLIFKIVNIYGLFEKDFISPLGKNSNLRKVNLIDEKIKNVEQLLEKNQISFSSVQVSSSSSILIKTVNGGEAVFSSEKSLETQVSSLQLILSRLTIEGKRFERLDFRFDKPIIVLK